MTTRINGMPPTPGAISLHVVDKTASANPAVRIARVVTLPFRALSTLFCRCSKISQAPVLGESLKNIRDNTFLNDSDLGFLL